MSIMISANLKPRKNNIILSATKQEEELVSMTLKKDVPLQSKGVRNDVMHFSMHVVHVL